MRTAGLRQLVRVVHNHRSALLTRCLFVRSLLVLCVAKGVLSCHNSFSGFVGRSSGQTHHGREKQPVIFPHMVLSLDAETSFFETIKVLLDDLIWMISLIIMLQYPSKKLYWKLSMLQIPRPTTFWDVFQTLFFIMGFQLPTSTGESRIARVVPDPSLEGCSAWPRRNWVFRVGVRTVII